VNSDVSLEEQEEEENFFACLAEVAAKIGEWSLELYANEEKLLPIV